MTLTNLPDISCQLSRIRRAWALPVHSAWRRIRSRSDVLIFLLVDRFQIDHVEVAERVEQLMLVEDVGDAAAHSGGEVSAGASDDDHRAAGHVLAGMIADAFDDGHGAAVADGESLADQAVDKHFAGRGAVKERVAGDDVFFRIEGRTGAAFARRFARPRGPCPGNRWRRRSTAT